MGGREWWHLSVGTRKRDRRGRENVRQPRSVTVVRGGSLFLSPPPTASPPPPAPQASSAGGTPQGGGPPAENYVSAPPFPLGAASLLLVTTASDGPAWASVTQQDGARMGERGAHDPTRCTDGQTVALSLYTHQPAVASSPNEIFPSR